MIWNFDTFGNNTAILMEDGSKLSYADLLIASDKLADQIPVRCLTFNLCTNEIGSLLGYVSFLNHHIVPCLIDAGLDYELLYSLFDTYKPNYIWCPSNMISTFSNCQEVYSIFGYSLLKTTDKNVYPLYNKLALLLTTSGSTGSPKLVRQSYTNIKTNTESIVEYLKLNETERVITTLPMSYTFGLSILNTHLYVGASIILTEKTMMQREFWQQFKDFETTSFGGVPYTYEILEKLRFFRMDLPSLRIMIQAGGKLSLELHKKFAEYALKKNKNFVVMYGQTEATARMSYLPPEKTHKKYGSMGIAIPGGKFSLINTEGKTINEPETVGELVYEGKNVTLGYANCGEDLSKGDNLKGILETGDMARRDADGYYYIVGRKKRFLKIFGNRINMDEIERILKTKFSKMDCACIGRDDKIYIFLTKDNQKNEVKEFLVKKIKLNPIAFQLKTIDQIIKNKSGKVLYKELARYYET